jgi:hypothetical protein
MNKIIERHCSHRGGVFFALKYIASDILFVHGENIIKYFISGAVALGRRLWLLQTTK